VPALLKYQSYQFFSHEKLSGEMYSLSEIFTTKRAESERYKVREKSKQLFLSILTDNAFLLLLILSEA
jgi:hypothetical protein